MQPETGSPLIIFAQAGGQIAEALAPAPGRDRMHRAVLTREAPSTRQQDQRERGSPPDARGTRAAAFTASSYDPETRTVEAVFSAGTRVRRWFGYEELAIEDGAIDLTRVERNLCPFLNSHNQWDVGATLGTVVSARIENGQLVGTLRFGDTEVGRSVEGMVSRGELTGVSIGYLVRNWQLTEVLENEDEIWRAMSWELLEVSLVSVPADPNAGVRSISGNAPSAPAAPIGTTEEEDEMLRRNLPGGTAAVTTAAPAAPAAPTTPADDTRSAPTPAPAPAAPTVVTVNAEAVRTAATNAGLDNDATIDLLSRHADQPFTSERLFAEIGRRFAERDTQATTVNRVTVTRDEGDTMRRGMEEAIFFRMSPTGEMPEVARNFRGMNLLRMAEELLVSRGVTVRGLTPNEIAERSLHATSDFPALMANGMNRRLRQAYQESQPTYRRWARRAPNAPNFKSVDVVQLSAMPDLLQVNEGGEIKYGSVSDGIISYRVLTYGRIIGITRQVIVNDDLRALDRATAGFAGSSARLENRTVYAQITGNPVMPDGNALFSAPHGNVAGAGAAPSQTTLGQGRARMRKQKGLQGEELNIAPAFLIVPTDLEQVAYQFTSNQFVPETAGNVNEFRQGGRTALEPIVEPVLDANSLTRWYLAANNSQVDTVEYAYLEGAEGPQLSSRLGFTVDGVEIKATLDFAAAAIDWRGLDRNDGA